MDFKLSTEYIHLNSLIKICGITLSGGEANQLILTDKVTVNGKIENQKRKKIRSGDQVEINKQTINIH